MHLERLSKSEKKDWTHWDLNPGPSACEADLIPLHHVPHAIKVHARILTRKNNQMQETGICPDHVMFVEYMLMQAFCENSAAGTWTRVFRVTGVNTNHYTTADHTRHTASVIAMRLGQIWAGICPQIWWKILALCIPRWYDKRKPYAR